MSKKLKEQAKDDDTLFASAVRTSAQQIWQAGLGAFAKAQEEGGRVFNRLVQEGTEMQKRSRSGSEEPAADMSDTVTRAADGVSQQAAGSWDKLEQIFEERVARALGAIGVPTRKDIDTLTRQVEQLTQTVAELYARTHVAAAREPAAKAAKPAVKPAAKAVKPAVKLAAKAVKPAVKPAAKTAVKTAAKPPVKSASEPALKAAGKSAPRKPAAKRAGSGAAPGK